MTSLIVTQVLLGLTIGMILVMISAGLSLIFGVMKVINFAHGALYALGAYFGLTIVALVDNFWLALILAPLPVMAVGLLIEYVGVRPLYSRDHLFPLLLTFGVALILQQTIHLLWGPRIQSIPVPDFAIGFVELAGIFYPKYRLFALLLSAGVVALLWLFVNRSKYGLIIRAGAQDAEMVQALGIDISKVFSGVYVLGAGLAAVAGVIVGPMGSVYPEMGMDMIITAFIVVVIGGLGSLQGAAIGALLLGLTESLSALWFPPDFVQIPLYVVMALILVLRPTGLFGERELAR